MHRASVKKFFVDRIDLDKSKDYLNRTKCYKLLKVTLKFNDFVQFSPKLSKNK
jgi:hypothetical protein